MTVLDRNGDGQSNNITAVGSAGHGLLGFLPRTELGPGESAYLNALGLSAEDVRLLLLELRENLKPLTRR